MCGYAAGLLLEAASMLHRIQIWEWISYVPLCWFDHLDQVLRVLCCTAKGRDCPAPALLSFLHPVRSVESPSEVAYAQELDAGPPEFLVVFRTRLLSEHHWAMCSVSIDMKPTTVVSTSQQCWRCELGCTQHTFLWTAMFRTRLDDMQFACGLLVRKSVCTQCGGQTQVVRFGCQSIKRPKQIRI